MPFEINQLKVKIYSLTVRSAVLLYLFVLRCNFGYYNPLHVQTKTSKMFITLLSLTVDQCEGIFVDASHCWPFNEANELGQSPDERGDSPAFLKVCRHMFYKRNVAVL